MTTDLISLEMADEIAWLTLRDPKGVNALSKTMINQICDALDVIDAKTGCRVVVIKAEGRAFCVGHDLKEMQGERTQVDGGKAAFEALITSCTAMMLKLQALRQVVIAVVDGVATAAGCQLVAACDLALASSKARFGVNGIDVGLFCSTPMVPVSRAIAPRHAFEMLVTGGFISAEDAAAKGLINRVVPADALLSEAADLAQTIVGKEPAAIAIGKAAFYQQLGEPLEEAYRCGTDAIVTNLMLPETDAAMERFSKK